MIEGEIFVPTVRFLGGSLASPHNSDNDQTDQSVFTTDKRSASVVEKQDTGEGTAKRLTKAIETLKVKSKFVVCPTEKPEFF